MIIKIAGLKDGVFQYKFDLDRKEIGLDESFISNVRSKVELKKSNTQVFVECESLAIKTAECDRCLDSFKLTLKAKFTLLYTYEKDFSSEKNEEIIFLEEYEDTVNLSDPAREALLLSIPLKLLCKEECKGLCIKCGKNLNIEQCKCDVKNIHPEFEKLKELNFYNNN